MGGPAWPPPAAAPPAKSLLASVVQRPSERSSTATPSRPKPMRSWSTTAGSGSAPPMSDAVVRASASASARARDRLAGATNRVTDEQADEGRHRDECRQCHEVLCVGDGEGVQRRGEEPVLEEERPRPRRPARRPARRRRRARRPARGTARGWSTATRRRRCGTRRTVRSGQPDERRRPSPRPSAPRQRASRCGPRGSTGRRVVVRVRRVRRSRGRRSRPRPEDAG